MRITAPRERVFALLRDVNPQSMSQLMQRAGKSMDRVTMYRTLESFERIGVVHRVNSGWKHKFELSDSFLGHHHHITCQQCGKTTDLHDEQEVEEIIKTIANRSGFQPLRHTFEIEGVCEDCI